MQAGTGEGQAGGEGADLDLPDVVRVGGADGGREPEPSDVAARRAERTDGGRRVVSRVAPDVVKDSRGVKVKRIRWALIGASFMLKIKGEPMQVVVESREEASDSGEVIEVTPGRPINITACTKYPDESSAREALADDEQHVLVWLVDGVRLESCAEVEPE